MTPESLAGLCGLAAGLGALHTLAGPDHYLPFVVLARARRWSAARTALVTALCGAGHVLGSILIGAAGIGAGLALGRLESIEASRGDLAAWGMVLFGVGYAVWGWWRKGRQHRHPHLHTDGTVHAHDHGHLGGHAHFHEHRGRVTPWALFIVFVLGPCEVLIPLLFAPAAQRSAAGVALVALVFGAATIGTMITTVLVLRAGARQVRTEWLERNLHPLAGGTIAACGALMLIGL